MAAFVRGNRRGSVVFRTAFFLPFIVGLATESFMLLLELQPDSGAIDAVLGKLGLASASTAWTVHYGLALGAICVFVVWFASGLTMMILMGGMQGIPVDLYEASDVDGATWWQKERRITIPMLRRSIALSLIISVIGSFLAFNQFFILTEGGPGTSTEPLVMWIYQEAFIAYHLGYATAGVKAVPLSEKDGGKCVEAMADNAYSGAYPMARFLFVYINKAPGKALDPLTREFVKVIASREGQEGVIKDGYFPIPATIAKEELSKIQ